MSFQKSPKKHLPPSRYILFLKSFQKKSNEAVAFSNVKISTQLGCRLQTVIWFEQIIWNQDNCINSIFIFMYKNWIFFFKFNVKQRSAATWRLFTLKGITRVNCCLRYLSKMSVFTSCKRECFYFYVRLLMNDHVSCDQFIESLSWLKVTQLIQSWRRLLPSGWRFLPSTPYQERYVPALFIFFFNLQLSNITQNEQTALTKMFIQEWIETTLYTCRSTARGVSVHNTFSPTHTTVSLRVEVSTILNNISLLTLVYMFYI